jgi:integral membrane sensor domain MASE1
MRSRPSSPPDNSRLDQAPTSFPFRSRLADGVVPWLLTALAYTAAAKVGLALAFVNASTTAVWPPTGIALGAVLILGWRRAAPGILLGAFLANQTTTGSWPPSLAIAVGNTCEALAGAYLVNRFAGGRDALNRARDLILFVILAALVSTAISATVGATSLSLYGLAEWSDYRSIWLTWWLGDAAGAIVVTPVLLLWYANPRVVWSRRQSVEALVLVLALVVVGWLTFVRVTFPLTFLVLPLGVWAGFRFGAREAATATCVLSVIAVWGTANGFGSFGSESPNSALLLLQAFMSVNTIIGITVGATVASREEAVEHARRLNDDLERRVRVRTAELLAAHDDLHTSEARLKEAQEAAHIGSWEWQLSGGRVWWSKELYRICGVDPEAFVPSQAAFLSLYIQTTAHH